MRVKEQERELIRQNKELSMRRANAEMLLELQHMDPDEIENKFAVKKRQEAKTRALVARLLAGHLQRQRMPTFQMYSKLDKNLLKRMIIRLTEVHDDDIDNLRQQYFNPVPDEASLSEDSSMEEEAGDN